MSFYKNISKLSSELEFFQWSQLETGLKYFSTVCLPSRGCVCGGCGRPLEALEGPEWWASCGWDDIWELGVRWPPVMRRLPPEVSTTLGWPLGAFICPRPCVRQSAEPGSSCLRERVQSEAFELAEKEL